jgi:hypothetical protein
MPQGRKEGAAAVQCAAVIHRSLADAAVELNGWLQVALDDTSCVAVHFVLAGPWLLLATADC